MSRIEWYDLHWNPFETFRHVASDMKWYHYGERSIIDVTDYEDALKAVENGRLEKIIEEGRNMRRSIKG